LPFGLCEPRRVGGGGGVVNHFFMFVAAIALRATNYLSNARIEAILSG